MACALLYSCSAADTGVLFLPVDYQHLVMYRAHRCAISRLSRACVVVVFYFHVLSMHGNFSLDENSFGLALDCPLRARLLSLP